ncbi:hypothetical protein GLW04_03475 [Halobacillus litoralis]|uniref:Uncharacterized protein n=1 Tax=Halobacillus litoralis TaxID=45668 RepID=A0A845DQW7_9BACI|nr:hypothetical protein [Halobacillus litoralis]MYL18935.1 hypothetical protein [Halobacillus litoralis]MYL39433.1 hypothetical protein [Halobacillus litoralis]
MTKYHHIGKVLICFFYVFLIAVLQPDLQKLAASGHIYYYLLLMQTVYIPAGIILALPVSLSSYRLSKRTFFLLTLYVLPCFLFLYVPFFIPGAVIFPERLHADPYAGVIIQVLLGYGAAVAGKESAEAKNSGGNGRRR